MIKQYPSILKTKEINEMSIFKRFDGESYEEDYKDAEKYSKKVKGEIYTIIDNEGKVAYIKGKQFVNRLGYIVVKW